MFGDKSIRRAFLFCLNSRVRYETTEQFSTFSRITISRVCYIDYFVVVVGYAQPSSALNPAKKP